MWIFRFCAWKDYEFSSIMSEAKQEQQPALVGAGKRWAILGSLFRRQAGRLGTTSLHCVFA